ncbi:MAG: MFS transporter [Patescibacteria group bacterium]
MRFLSRISTIPKNIWGFAYYDFANSAYFLVYLSFLLPIYFSTILLSKGYSLGAWGTANAVSTFLGVLLAVVAGKYADTTNRLEIFRYSVFLSFIGMLSVSLSIGYFPASVYWIFIIANTFFVASLSISDSMLPHVSDKTTSYTYGGFAWGFGYLGGIASLLIVVFLQKITGDYSFSVFASVAIFYLIFSLYSIRKLSGTPLNPDSASDKTANMLSPGREKLLFLGYWLISECITVVFLFFSIFASQELRLSTFVIGVLLLFVQLIAFPATYLGGMLAERRNPQTLLGITIALWGVIILLLVLFKGFIVLAIVVFLTGLVIGNSQSYMRAQYSTLIKKGESGLRFGFYSIVSKASVIVGPVAYGFASDQLQSQKIPIIILYALMVLGYVLTRKALAPANTRGAGLSIV